MSKGDDDNDVEMPDINEIIPYLNIQADSLIDTQTPYGSVTFDTTYKEPLSYDDWYSGQDSSLWSTPTSSAIPFEEAYPDAPRQNSPEWWEGDWNNTYQDYNNAPQTTASANDPLAMYNDYVNNFDKGLGETTTNVAFSDEIQGLWDKVWDPNAYDNYATDYMDTYNALLDPYRSMQMDDFEQSMFDRGLPEGGEIYGDLYTTTIGDSNARQDLMAAQEAAYMGDTARINDLNALAQAFGMTTGVSVPQIDVMGPANLAANTEFYNTQADSQSSSDIWNALGLLGGGYLSSGDYFWS